MYTCDHPRDRRREAEGGKVFCGRCGRTFRPHTNRAYHGTPGGYNKHKKERKGDWGWPACPPCKAAQKQWSAEYKARPENQEKESRRTLARTRALRRLKVRYPADYAKFYSEELALLENTGTEEQLRAEYEALLRQNFPGGRSIEGIETEFRRMVRGGWATVEEQQRWRRALVIKVKLEQLRGRAAGPGS